MVCLCPVPGMTTNQQASSLSDKVLNLFHVVTAVCCTNKHAQVFPEICQLTLHPCFGQNVKLSLEVGHYADDTIPALVQPVDGIVPKRSQ